jgi:transcription elongation GreA/GreB family factor
MSVAFRRESDEEHLEPKFEVPIAPGPNLVTPRGRALIAAQVETLDKAIAECAEGPEAVLRLKRDLRYWGTRLATAEVAPPPPDGQVGLGSRVRFSLNGTERAIHIVGGDEAEPAEGRVAFSAPLARALMGLVKGDLADFAGKVDAIEVLGVEFS